MRKSLEKQSTESLEKQLEKIWNEPTETSLRCKKTMAKRDAIIRELTERKKQPFLRGI